jgi:cytochrome P450
MHAARRKLDALIFREITRRRANPDPGREDIMSLLLEARDEDGTGLSDQEIRDQVMTLMFAGHDTTTSTIAFLFHELAGSPHERELLQQELAGVLGGAAPTPEQAASALPRTEMAIDETLRMYPAAWIGARRTADTYEFNGVKVPKGAPVMYSSWASHHLPEVFPQPEEFRPDRFTPEARAALPKGAYVPFGGGSRTCIGMRFGLMEIRVIAAMVLQRFSLEHVPGYRMSIRQMPTISPKHGLPMTLRAA